MFMMTRLAAERGKQNKATVKSGSRQRQHDNGALDSAFTLFCICQHQELSSPRVAVLADAI